MNKKIWGAIFAVAVFGFVIFSDTRFVRHADSVSNEVGSTISRVTSIEAYPNPIYTVGIAATLDLEKLVKVYDGKTYSQAHRDVPESEKKQVLAEYGNPTGKIEIDHFYPVCAGGANDIKNLWAQPEHVIMGGVDYGFHAKDKLESFVCREIKGGRLSPTLAFKRITEDWVKYYQEAILRDNNLGGISVGDEDDKIF